jgi:RNA polymerase sigma-70 factor (ECF subfamily)
MKPNDATDRLSQISTRWSMLFEAHQTPAGSGRAAQRALLLRYHGAVYRYLLGMLHDADVAEELTQDFAVRFLRGDFATAAPTAGRFRDFLKTAVRHLVIDYWRKQEKEKRRAALPQEVAEPALVDDLEADGLFREKWREELLARTWQALAELEKGTGQPYHTILRYKVDHPQLRSTQLAAELAPALGKALSAAAARQTLHRAREKFADLLVAEVARSLETSQPEPVEQELIDLDLLDYCRSALQRLE